MLAADEQREVRRVRDRDGVEAGAEHNLAPLDGASDGTGEDLAPVHALNGRYFPRNPRGWKLFPRSTVKIHCIIRALHPRHAFGISRAVKTEVRNVFLRLEHDGVNRPGRGVAESVLQRDGRGRGGEARRSARFHRIAGGALRADIEAAWENVWPLLAPSRAAQCALDLALWDWLARREGMSVAELAWGEKPRPGDDVLHDRPFVARGTGNESWRSWTPFRASKSKADGTGSLAAVRLARTRTNAMLAVDANCAWAESDVRGLSAELAGLGVAFIEQPLPPEQDTAMPGTHPLPFLADESCVTEEDVPRVARHFDGFQHQSS